MTTCHNFMRYSLFAFNATVLIIGCVVIFNALLMDSVMETLKKPGDSSDSGNLGDLHFILPNIMMSIGTIVLLVSLCGCCGALHRKSYVMCIYAILLFILLFVEGVICSIVWVNQDELMNAFNNILKTMWKYHIDDFHAIEFKLHCCGVNGISDYLKDLTVPPSVCCPQGQCTGFNSYKGCSTVLINLFTDNIEVAKHIAGGLIVAQILGFIFACILCSDMRSRKRQTIAGF